MHVGCSYLFNIFSLYLALSSAPNVNHSIFLSVPMCLLSQQHPVCNQPPASCWQSHFTVFKLFCLCHILMDLYTFLPDPLLTYKPLCHYFFFHISISSLSSCLSFGSGEISSPSCIVCETEWEKPLTFILILFKTSVEI